MTEGDIRSEQLQKPPLDAVIVCGMGPVALRETQDPENLVAQNLYTFLNAISAKLLVSGNVADQAIVSGYASGKNIPVTEAELLAATYIRATPTEVNKEARLQANDQVVLEREALTTVGNIVQSLNMLDREAGGQWSGSFAVLSSEFHVPRLQEMLTIFGLEKGRVLSAERIFRHFGYEGRLHPIRGSGTGTTWSEFEEGIYRGQPGGLENLQDNPGYIAYELAKIESPQRFHDMTRSFITYYQSRGVALPEVFDMLPPSYDPQFDYSGLRAGIALIPSTKHPYSGEAEETVGYRELASYIGDQTSDFLESVQTG